MLYGAALRRSEAVGLDLADYEPTTGALTVRAGKGRKDRIAYVPQGGRAALGAWLSVRGAAPGALFWPVNKAGVPDPRRLSPAAVYRILARLGDETGIKAFSPHDMRRSSISDLLDAGADIATVQRWPGTPTSRPRAVTIDEAMPPRRRRPICCMCRMASDAVIQAKTGGAV